MRYWLTTHDPHPTVKHPWFLYMKDRYVQRAATVKAGDWTAFYETGGREGEGRKGVVALGRIVGPRRETENTGGRVDDLGRPEWRWEWPTDAIDFDGFLGLETVLDVVERGSIRIPGGLAELTPNQWGKLASEFKRRPRQPA